MKYIILPIALLSLLYACTTNKVTGKKQLNIISSAQMLSLSEAQYKQVLQQSKVITGTTEAKKVTEIGKRLASVVTKYYSEKGMEAEMANYKWEYNLIESKDVNAWCMPGGKIAVYTGILPVTQNDDALAIVMGHELAHALAEHGKQRIHQQLGTELASLGLQGMLAGKPQQTRDAFLSAFGVATTLGYILPFSRKQELEADKLGLQFAAMAGYNPEEAIPLWQRMAALSKGNKPPEFASTHPAEETRIAALQQQMPAAKKLYEAAKKSQ